MTKSFAALLAAGVLAVGTLAGCSVPQDKVTGELIAKEYEPRNCEKRSKGKCKKWDPAEHELTIRTDAGDGVELVVTKSVYDRATVKSTGTWKGRID